jgi:hypothetical protein
MIFFQTAAQHSLQFPYKTQLPGLLTGQHHPQLNYLQTPVSIPAYLPVANALQKKGLALNGHVGYFSPSNSAVSELYGAGITYGGGLEYYFSNYFSMGLNVDYWKRSVQKQCMMGRWTFYYGTFP